MGAGAGKQAAPPAPPPPVQTAEAPKPILKKENSKISFRVAGDDEPPARISKRESFGDVKMGKQHVTVMSQNLFRVENAVTENQVNALQARSQVQENAALIQKNYSSAFSGNWQMINQNTDDLTRNRLAILSAWAAKATNGTQRALAEALMHKEKIGFLKHHAKLNEQVLDVTKTMAGVNAASIAMNESVITR